ncbi:MAG: FHA domain-containing protein [Planctomycetia bacterium]|nr:FHA domain-containing protein [Planctomycetia bacterium]
MPPGPARPPACAVPSPEPPTAPSHAVLELVVGDGGGPAFPLPTDRATTLGRSADADIPLGDRLVSRLHASVRLEPSGWTLRDLGSRNGTRLDGVTVASAQLHPGALIGIGTFSLLFRAAALPSPPALPRGWHAVRWCPPAELAGEGLRHGAAPGEQAAQLVARHVAALRLMACRGPDEIGTAVVELALAHCGLAAAGWFTPDPGAAPSCTAPEGNGLAALVTPELLRPVRDGGLAVWLTRDPSIGGAPGRGDLACIPVGPGPAALLVAQATGSPLRAADLAFLGILVALAAAHRDALPGTEGIAARVATAPNLEIAVWERTLIAEAVRRHGHMVDAARALGMSRATLYRRVGSPPPERPAP